MIVIILLNPIVKLELMMLIKLINKIKIKLNKLIINFEIYIEFRVK